jgi:hypothetical protein
MIKSPLTLVPKEKEKEKRRNGFSTKTQQDVNNIGRVKVVKD